jgi:hypothetical protein
VGFRVISLHGDGVEKAPVETSLATDAFFKINQSAEAAGGYEFVGVGQTPIHAAVSAAVTDDVIDILSIVGNMHQTFFFSLV